MPPAADRAAVLCFDLGEAPELYRTLIQNPAMNDIASSQ